MSTTWSYTCLDHTPHLHSDDAATGGRGLERMRLLYDHRTDMLAAIATLREIDFDVWNFDPDENVAVRFFMQHPSCHLGATSEDGYIEFDPPHVWEATAVTCPTCEAIRKAEQ